LGTRLNAPTRLFDADGEGRRHVHRLRRDPLRHASKKQLLERAPAVGSGDDQGCLRDAAGPNDLVGRRAVAQQDGRLDAGTVGANRELLQFFQRPRFSS